ncbi:hypothetical protein [Streptomyces sp. NPDC093093]|uniref:hypothetical protein n=1 Tax=Streptomyces sp. NPDC093093 TaxID=3366025 RepID=UPI0037FD9CAA
MCAERQPDGDTTLTCSPQSSSSAASWSSQLPVTGASGARSFDAYIRTFVAEGAGRTLADAIAHWHATRQAAVQLQEIGSQFELNRFLRDWHAEHPAGSCAEVLAAWRAHRDRPRRPAAG